MKPVMSAVFAELGAELTAALKALGIIRRPARITRMHAAYRLKTRRRNR